MPSSYAHTSIIIAPGVGKFPGRREGKSMGSLAAKPDVATVMLLKGIKTFRTPFRMGINAGRRPTIRKGRELRFGQIS